MILAKLDEGIFKPALVYHMLATQHYYHMALPLLVHNRLGFTAMNYKYETALDIISIIKPPTYLTPS